MLQVHSLQDPFTSKLISAVSQNVTAFDCSEGDNLLTCFALQRSNRTYYAYYSENRTALVTSDGQGGAQQRYILVQTQISLDNQLDLQRQVDVGDCLGERLLVLQYFVVIACPSYAKARGRVILVNRKTMKVIEEFIGDDEKTELGRELTELQSQDGIQSFVFFTQQMSLGAPGTSSYKRMAAINQVEVIYNKEKASFEVQKNMKLLRDQDNKNQGQLSLGAGGRTLLYLYETFDKISGSLFCFYNEIRDPNDLYSCNPCPAGSIGLI